MRRLALILSALVLLMTGRLCAAENRFALILIDAQTEKIYGEFPIDRGLIARGLDELARLKAKGVVLKFFYDQPKNPQSDKALAQAMRQLPTILQACIDDSVQAPNPFSDRFAFQHVAPQDAEAFSGRSGLLPFAIFSAAARDIGFVDLPSPGKTPIIEKYQGKFARSLLLSALELSYDSEAAAVAGRSLNIAGASIPLDAQNSIPIVFPKANAPAYFGFHDLLAGKLTPDETAGRVIILGHDGPKIPKIDSPSGPIGAHIYFYYSLLDLANRIDQARLHAPKK